MGKKRKSKANKQARQGLKAVQEEDYKKCPHSFVFQRGDVGRKVKVLVKDMRRVMEPYTASSLKVRKNNILQDYVNVAGPMNISHFLIFTKTKLNNYMRVMRLPRGPTLTFKINEYSLCRDVISSIKHHNMEQKQFQHHPLLVMNGFSGDGMHYKLITTMFQNIFPSINVNTVKLSAIRRCAMLNYNKDDNTIEFRHYNIKVVPVGMSRGVKKLIKAKIPDMGRYEDVSELLLRGADLSESEAEIDGPHNEVILPQDVSSRGNMKAAKSAIRLTEVGPRLKLELIKIEDGLCQGEVLYHSLVQKTEQEIKALKLTRHKKKSLKEKRKKQQEANIKKKEELKSAHKKKSLAGMKKPEPEAEFEEVAEGEQMEKSKGDGDFSSDDDISYYRQEVGEDPDPEMFPAKSGLFNKRGRSNSRPGSNVPNKRRKPNDTKRPSGQYGNKSNEKTHGKFQGKPRSKTPLTEMDRIKQRKQKKQRELEKKTGKNRKILHNRAPRGRKR